MTFSADMVSEFSKDIYRHYHDGQGGTDGKTKQIMLNVRDKHRYVVHIRNLKFTWRRDYD